MFTDKKWAVVIPSSRWMTGVHHFKTKKGVMEFISSWNSVEIQSGFSYTEFKRVSGTKLFKAQAG
jgi:hypothetical protein